VLSRKTAKIKGVFVPYSPIQSVSHGLSDGFLYEIVTYISVVLTLHAVCAQSIFQFY
jgi:hypothetical protein